MPEYYQHYSSIDRSARTWERLDVRLGRRPFRSMGVIIGMMIFFFIILTSNFV